MTFRHLISFQCSRHYRICKIFISVCCAVGFLFSTFLNQKLHEYFAIIFLIFFTFISVSYSINVSVFAFGISKNASLRKAFDFYPFNLEVLKYVFDEVHVFSGKHSNVNLDPIFDNRSPDFDMGGKYLRDIEGILRKRSDHRFMHIGPFCEY